MVKRVSVIIPTKGRSDELKNAISSLRGQTQPIYELLIIDDSPIHQFDLNGNAVKELMNRDGTTFPIRHIKGHGIGMTEARNHGAEVSEGDIVTFLDDDVVLDPDYFRYVTRSFEDTGLAGATGMITNPVENSAYFNIFSFLTFNSITSTKRGYMRRSGYPCFLVKSEKPTQVEVMSGCNMSFVREVFLKYRSDEKLIGYSYLEDADLTYRISRDHAMVMEPRSKLRHNTVQKSVGDNYCTVRMAYHHYLFRKNMLDSPINWFPYAISVVSDLVLVVVAALKNKNFGLITAALKGLSKDAMP